MNMYLQKCKKWVKMRRAPVFRAHKDSFKYKLIGKTEQQKIIELGFDLNHFIVSNENDKTKTVK